MSKVSRTDVANASGSVSRISDVVTLLQPYTQKAPCSTAPFVQFSNGLAAYRRAHVLFEHLLKLGLPDGPNLLLHNLPALE